MAQLVARLVRNEKVGGSNPPSSTTDRHPIVDVGFSYVWACYRPSAVRRKAGAGVPVGLCAEGDLALRTDVDPFPRASAVAEPDS